MSRAPFDVLVAIEEHCYVDLLETAIDLAKHRAAEAVVAFATNPEATDLQEAMQKALDAYELLIDATCFAEAKASGDVPY
jgi:hypothetical protein